MYQRSFQAFTDSSTVKQPAMHGIRQALIKIIENVVIDEPIKVLGIGSGNGEIDLLILQNLAEYLISQKKKKPTIQSVIVEPNSFLLDQFKLKVSSLRPLESAANQCPSNGDRQLSVNSTKKPPLKRKVSILFILSTVFIIWT